jgi:hypothetical protein
MPDDRRWRVPGGSYCFTVNLLNRTVRVLVDHLDVLPSISRCANPPQRRDDRRQTTSCAQWWVSLALYPPYKGHALLAGESSR